MVRRLLGIASINGRNEMLEVAIMLRDGKGIWRHAHTFSMQRPERMQDAMKQAERIAVAQVHLHKRPREYEYTVIPANRVGQFLSGKNPK